MVAEEPALVATFFFEVNLEVADLLTCLEVSAEVTEEFLGFLCF